MYLETSADLDTTTSNKIAKKGLVAHISLVGLLVSLGAGDLAGSQPAIAKPIQPKAAAPEPTLLRPITPPVAIIKPVGDLASVKLINNTYTTITYQAIGDTEERSLPARSTITLRNLKTPTSLTFYRSDRGFLLVQPKASGATLEMTMTASDDFSVDKTFMEIKATGEVYLN